MAKILNCLSQNEVEILVPAFISSELNFCNALLYGLPRSVLDGPQYVQNCAPRHEAENFVNYTAYQSNPE